MCWVWFRGKIIKLGESKEFKKGLKDLDKALKTAKWHSDLLKEQIKHERFLRYGYKW